MRALLVHGLGLGLDADPGDVDAIAGEGDHDPVDPDADSDQTDSLDGASRDRRLFTWLFVEERNDQRVYAFGAMMAANADEALDRLMERYGADYAGSVVLQDGFDACSPLATTLLSSAIVDMLTQFASDPTSPLADGLELMVEQRFSA